jgi:hypothetical protein
VLPCGRYTASLNGRQLSPGVRAVSIASANVVAAKGFLRNPAAPSFFARSRSAGFSLALQAHADAKQDGVVVINQ